MKFKRYRKDADYSYCLGVFPSLELLEHRPEQLLHVFAHSQGMNSPGVQRVAESCAARGVPFEVNDKAIARLSHKGNTYLIAMFAKYQQQLEPQRHHLLLVNPSDSGNLGTIMRSMLAFGLRDLALIRPAVDAFHPQTLRAAMGARFALRLHYVESLEAYQQHYAHAERRLYPFMLEADCSLAEAAFQPASTLIFGNESSGLPAHYRHCGQALFIPQSPLVDSLNLAVAVAVGLYALQQSAPAL